jgi:hypothetical protein
MTRRCESRVRIYCDRTGNTLTVWFDNPRKESVCEEIDDDVVLIKDDRGLVIGFERLNYPSSRQQHQGTHVLVEVRVIGG